MQLIQLIGLIGLVASKGLGGKKVCSVEKGIANKVGLAGGSCSFPPADFLQRAAVNDQMYGEASMCGVCLEVKSNHKKAIVQVVDRCPDCKLNQITLNEEAYQALGYTDNREIHASWKEVPCPQAEPEAGLEFKWQAGSNQWWAAFTVIGHPKRILGIEYYKEGQWLELKRTNYNAFIVPAAVLAAPFKVRVLDSQSMKESCLKLPGVKGDCPPASQ